MKKIYIAVAGGCVQSIVGDTDLVEVEVIDFDNDGSPEAEQRWSKILDEVENKDKGMMDGSRPVSSRASVSISIEELLSKMGEEENGEVADDIWSAISDLISDKTGFCHYGFTASIKAVAELDTNSDECVCE